jgi:phosphohistidine phosphatase
VKADAPLKLFFLRHAIAVPHGTPGVPEDERPLTKAGRVKMRRAAVGLKKLVSGFTAILSSPLPRAWQTAELVREVYAHKPAVRRCDPLLPDGSTRRLMSALEGFAPGDRVLLVGHQPGMGGHVGALVWGSGDDGVALKKGGLCRVDLLRASGRSRGELRWLLTPRILRLIADL